MNHISQLGQEKFLNDNYFHNKKDGIFVDIGAHNGITYSNSKFFEEMGWRGMCVEPNPEVFKQLRENRNCICENYAISDEEGVGEFLLVKGWAEMLSGLVKDYIPAHTGRIDYEIEIHGGSKEVIPVNTIKLQTLIEKHNLTNIDFLSIDTEGNELKVIKSIDFSKTSVFAITVENNYRETFIKEYLTSIGFTHVTDLVQDEVYINNNYKR